MERPFSTLRNWGERGWNASTREMGGFKKFILRGNVVDLAVGVVIGAAFSGVVDSLVKDFISPLIGVALLTLHLNQDFKNAFWEYQGQRFAFGDFVNALISFLIVAFVLYFFVVRPVALLQDRFLPREEPKAPEKRECPFCLSEVPLKATRCAYCTAQLPPAEEGTPAEVR
uniref:Large-conductance mechanosensitive channel n=1 Tax=Thermosporothrix sp. COM3 TaxID=2490863 RepID=A0A455SQQ8_9CHLR|nr:large-conductance mechanosensitive channel [Thermosporothrix sp. COM3]